MNLYYQADDGEYRQIKEVKDVDLTLEDDSEVLISPEPMEFTAELQADLRKLIPRGYRNSDILKKDGFLNMSNAELE